MPIRVGSLVQLLPAGEIEAALIKDGLRREIVDKFVKGASAFGNQIFTVTSIRDGFNISLVELRFGTDTLERIGETLIGTDCLREISNSKYPSNYAKQVSR